MITREEIIQIGEIAKVHGLDGELVLSFSNDAFIDEDIEFFIIDMDGIFVPFAIEEIRAATAEKAIISLKHIDSAESAKRLVKHEVYILIDEVEEIESVVAEKGAMDYFIGYTVMQEKDRIGIITDVNTSTINTLFLVELENGDEIYIPASQELFTKINNEKRLLSVKLPDGLLDIND